MALPPVLTLAAVLVTGTLLGLFVATPLLAAALVLVRTLYQQDMLGDPPPDRAGRHRFDRVCDEHNIDHRLTKPNHSWTNGQVERRNRTLEEATVKRDHDETRKHLEKHLRAFLTAWDFAKRLKTLKGLTPYGLICICCQKRPGRFRLGPHHSSGLYPHYSSGLYK